MAGEWRSAENRFSAEAVSRWLEVVVVLLLLKQKQHASEAPARGPNLHQKAAATGNWDKSHQKPPERTKPATKRA